MTLLARWRWPLVEGRVIDKRHIKRFLVRFDSSLANVSVDEYLVEFPGPDGTPSRAPVRAKSLKLPVAGVHVGQTVPLHVNRRGTRAVFGRFDTGEDRAKRRQRDKQQRARDEQRFSDKLEES